MKIRLQVNGQELIASPGEIREMLERHVPRRPVENQLFDVNPVAINQKLFIRKRADESQEATRQIILEALLEVKENPKYARKFSTLMPEKIDGVKTVKELKEIASTLGDHMADWVEQALEWAQRIQNGESWEEVCNKPDTANWYRLIVWKNKYARTIGGAQKIRSSSPASNIGTRGFSLSKGLINIVPLVVLYK